MRESLRIVRWRYAFGLLLTLLPLQAFAQTYPINSTVTNTTGSFTLESDSTGLTTFVEEYVDNVLRDRFWAPYTRTGKTNGVYVYQYIFKFELEGIGTYFIIVGTTTVTVQLSIPPTAPGTLSISDMSHASWGGDNDGNVTVSWGAASDNPTYYELYRRVDAGAWQLAYSGAATSVAQSSLASAGYDFQARACNAHGCGPYTNTATVSVFRTPATPNPVTLTNVSHPELGQDGDGAFTLNWTSVGTAGPTLSYTVFEYIDGVASNQYPSYETSMQFSGKGAATYEYRVYASAPLGGSELTTPVSVRVVVPPGTPGAITFGGLAGPAFNGDDDGSFTVSWGEAGGAVGWYELYRRVNTGAWTLAHSGAGTSASQNLGSTAAVYDFQVRACNAAGCGGYNAVAAVSVVPPPPVPGAITFTNLSHPQTAQDTDGAYDLAWGASTGALSYALQERVNSGSFVTLGSTVLTSPSFAISGRAGGTYEYRVNACSILGCSEWSAVKSVQVLQTPSVPQISAPASDTDGTYTVSWSATGTVANYTLQRLISGTWTALQDTSATSRSESGLGDGVYSYRVRACNALACTNWSTTATVQVARPVTSIASFPALEPAGMAGALPMQSNVNDKGGLVLQIALDLPGGVAGLAPGLSLTFNSLGDLYDPQDEFKNNRWTLDGISSIHTCDQDTRLCLDSDGMLTTENPEFAAPPVDQRYRVAKRQDTVVIRKVDGAGATWYLMKRGGREYKFGATPAGRKLRSDNYILEWYLEEVKDEFGNVMTVENQALSTVYPDKFPVAIRYGGYSVELVYNRVSQTGSSKLGLHTVRGVVNGVTTVEYRLIRGAVDELGLPAVNAVQKCGFTEAGTSPSCLAATTVDSITPASGARTIIVTDGLGARLEATLWPRAELASANALLGTGESPFPFPSGLGEAAFNLSGSEYEWVVTKLSHSDGVGGNNLFEFAYRNGGLSNDVVRQKLADGTYLYTSYLSDLGYYCPYGGQIIRQARFTGIAGTAGAKKLSFLENEWELLSWTTYVGSQLSAQEHYVALKKRKEHILDANGYIVGGTYSSFSRSWNPLTGLLSQVVATTVSGYDPSGESIAANVQRTVVETKNYSNDASTWIVGFMTDRTVQTAVPGRAGSKGIRTSYEPYLGYATYKVGETSVAADSGSGFVTQSTTANGFDALGNRSGVTVTGTDFATRYETYSNFIDDRYFTIRTQPTGTGYSLQNTIGYDRRFGTPSTVTDANNLPATQTRDAVGRVIRRTLPNGTVMAVAYESCTGLCGSLRAFDRGAPRYKVTETTTHPYEAYKGAPAQVRYFDERDRLIRVETEGFSSGQWSAVDSGYDALGQLQQRSLPYAISASASPQYIVYSYDALGRVTQATNPGGGGTGITYEQLTDQSRVTLTQTIVGPPGATTRVRVEEYDALGQLKKSTDASGSAEQVSTDYQYDQTGHVDQVKINGDNNTTVYSQYDAFGRATSIEDPSTGLVSYQYDGLGQLRFRMDADGITTRFDYDLLGRVYQRTDDEGGSGAVVNNWIFDTKKVGYLSARSSPGFSEEYAYDSFAQLQSSTTNIDTTGYSGQFSASHVRDNYGRITSTTYPSGLRASAVFNPQGLASEIRDARSNVLLSRIDSVNAFGGILQETLGNGLQTVRGFDPITGRLTSIRTGTLQDHRYQWWSDGLLYQRLRDDLGANETFTYDALGRLDATWTSSSAGTRSLDYSYDKLGNLTRKAEGGSANVTSYGYADTTRPHRMTSAVVAGVTHAFGYDAKGNITSTDASGVTDDRSLGFTASGLPNLITKGDPADPSGREGFMYGPDGERFYREALNKTTTPTTDKTVYLYGGAFEVLLPGLGTVRSYEKTYLGNVLHIREVATNGVATERVEYLHKDSLGSLDAITDPSGAELYRTSFDPFGSRRSNDWLSAGTPPSIASQYTHTSRGFTGHEHLYATGLIHMNGRVYDPAIGRFMSADPMVQAPSNSQSYNRYAYVFNSPLSYTDPTGYFGTGGYSLGGCANGGSECIEEVTTVATRIEPVVILPPVTIQIFFNLEEILQPLTDPAETGEPVTQPILPDEDPCTTSNREMMTDASNAMLKGWEKGFEAGALMSSRASDARSFSKAARGMGVLNLGINYAAMKSAYDRNDMTEALSRGADIAIDLGSNVLPGWGGLLAGGGCDLASCGDRFGQTYGPGVQLSKDLMSDFHGTSFRLAFGTYWPEAAPEKAVDYAALCRKKSK